LASKVGSFLASAEGFVSPRLVHERAIVWIDVPRISYDPGSDAAEGTLLNSREVAAIEQILGALQSRSNAATTSAVLTPYRRQVRELRLNLRAKPQWARLPDGYERLDQDRIGVFTVDSFQGRQASVIVVSLVRNNTERTINKAFGFLTEHERVNVMMSRAERLLILVGAWDFFRAHLVGKSREIGQPFAELGRVSDWLERAFDEKRALLISADGFARGAAL
jgi:hypothetical protein